MKAANQRTTFPALSFAQSACLPTQERVLDRLADLMLDADEVLDLLKGEDARTVAWVKPHVQNVYDTVNALMQRLCD